MTDPWLSPAVRQNGGISKIFRNVNDLMECVRQGDSLLDAGCGVGELYESVHHIVSYTGIDLYSAEEARRLHPSGNFKSGDFMDETGQYDVVWSSRTVIHFHDFEKAIRKLMSLARRICLITCHVSDDGVEKTGDVWSRTFSRDTLRAFGDCKIRTHWDCSYSSVIYRK